MKMIKAFVLFATMIFVSLANAGIDRDLKQEEIDRIALQSYIYLYPLVLMDVTRAQMSNMPEGKIPGRGPMNKFVHMRKFPDAKFREVVRPNFDTLYSLAWIDVSKEPMILKVPEVKDRFFMLPMYEMYTDTFAVVGTYANGTKAGTYALCTPQWKGKLPKGIMRIDAPTSLFWIIGRIQTNGVKDYEYIHKIQDSFKLTPLSYYLEGKKYQPEFVKDKSVDDKTPPMKQVEAMSAKDYFTYAMRLLQKYPPHITDMVRVDRMARIGLTPNNFYFDTLPEDIKKALQNANKISHKVMRGYSPKLGIAVNGWQMIYKSVGVYGNDYLQRATTALIGLGANPYYQAFYPLLLTDKNGKKPDSSKKYVMHFTKEQIPPVDAFWSITIYDKDGFPVANSINRYAIGDRDNLKFNKDGSLDIYIQHENPGKEKESNWLPAPKEGEFSLAMRLYAPKQKVIDGEWKPPYLEEVK